MKLFKFPFGNGNYDTQWAIVVAETIEDARALLIEDIARQTAAAPRRPSKEIDPNYESPEGWVSFYFEADRLEIDDKLPASEMGPITYLMGVDG